MERRLGEIARVFLKLGTIGFGGPAAHIALMEEEVVRKRHWLTHEHFIDLIGATNLIPGPNSTEMAMHCGQQRAGWRGLVVAGICFIAPAVVLTAVIASAYARYGRLPEVRPFFFGITPTVIALIAGAAWTLGRNAIKNARLGLLAALTLTACLLGMNEITALLLCGLVGALFALRGNAIGLLPVAGGTATSLAVLSTTGIFWHFLKIGAVLYGSGYVLFAFLDAELVQKGLLSHQVLVDAIAAGQFTPGPVLSAATFVGWQLKGPLGAAAATAGIFLPSFLFVALLNPLVPRLRRSPVMSAFLDAVNAGAIALIVGVCITLFRQVLPDWRTLLITLLALIVSLRFKRVPGVALMLGGALLGYLLWVLSPV